jgi:hypothetical protein
VRKGFLAPFEGSWYRIERAATHRQAAISKWNAFLNREPFDARVSVDDDGRGWIWIQQLERVPPSIGVLFGEYFYNLRTSLDYCLYDVAVNDSRQNPPPKASRLQFPIYSSEAAYDANRDRIEPLSPKHHEWLGDLQPFGNVNGPRGDALYWLNELARLDRHRQLHVIGAYVAESAPEIYAPGATSIVFEAMPSDIFVEGDTELCRFRLDPYSPGDPVEANPQTGLDIEIAEMVRQRPAGADWLFWPLPRRLFLIETFVDALVGRFERSCTGWTRSKYVTDEADSQ